jgi:methylenetetrahydrofolate reductase (NADPH)
VSGPAGRLERLARSRRFVVTAEVVPPRSADLEPLVRQARELVGYADGVNVTDNPTATAHMSPLAGVAAVADAGIEPILQLTTRDRNRLALTSDLLGGWALGARNLLCLSGDPVSVGDDPAAVEVRDLDLLQFVRLANGLRSEHAPKPDSSIDRSSIEPSSMDPPPRYFVGVADSPLARGYDAGRLEAKLDAGAGFVQTQIVFDVDALYRWADLVRARGVFDRAAVFVGVAPLRSAKQARYLDERVPGVSVPPSIVAALDAAGDAAEAEGVRQASVVVEALRAIDGVAGIHVIGLGREQAVRRLIEASGLAPRPVVTP